jgi:hypothetical protein
MTQPFNMAAALWSAMKNATAALSESFDGEIHQQDQRGPRQKKVGEQNRNAEQGRADIENSKHRKIKQHDAEQKNADQPLSAIPSPGTQRFIRIRFLQNFVRHFFH